MRALHEILDQRFELGARELHVEVERVLAGIGVMNGMVTSNSVRED